MKFGHRVWVDIVVVEKEKKNRTKIHKKENYKDNKTEKNEVDKE